MNKKLIFTALLSLLFATSCTTDPLDDGQQDSAGALAASKKFVNTPQNASTESLIVYFDDEAIETIESTTAQAAATRSDAAEPVTRSGIGSVDDIMDRYGVTSMRRVFPVNPRSEERARAAGLHKWYVLSFAESVDVEHVATKLAAIADVSHIEFNTKHEKAIARRPNIAPANATAIPTMAVEQPATRAAVFNDPLLRKQWHYKNTGDASVSPTARAGADINVEEAWKLTGGDPSIIVAIVDEGVKYSHPDLAANMWKSNDTPGNGIDDDNNGYVDDVHGYNFARNSATLTWTIVDYDSDGYNNGDSGHGTHVAGTVAAVNNNGTGLSGVAGGTGNNDGVKLMSCQTFSGMAALSGSNVAFADAIRYAADNGASIIQCSWGYDSTVNGDSAYASISVLKSAIDYFIATKNNDVVDGGLVIFAAGNTAKSRANYPGAYRDYIAVTSFSPDFLPAYYTSYGPGSNIAAPGGDFYISAGYGNGEYTAEIYSTVPSDNPEYQGLDYGTMQGTSMACPHVSGVAALGLAYAKAKGKQYTLGEFKSMILTSVNDIDANLISGVKNGAAGPMQLANYRRKMGTGIIDAFQLLMQIEGTPCMKIPVNSQQSYSLDQFFSEVSASLSYIDVQISQEDMTKLGMTTAPTMLYGKLRFTCTKPGVARIKVRAIAGGNTVGSGSMTGGMEISKEFAVIARSTEATNGGWL